jgi:hypothetical protein
MKYSSSFHIPRLDQIQQEALAYLEDKLSHTVRGIEISKNELHNFPTLLEFISSLTTHKLLDLRPLKFYINHPYENTKPHKDTGQPPIALNIPILNTKNSEFYYCSTTPDNLFVVNRNRKTGQGNAISCIDPTNITKIESIELSVPHLVRTDIMHGVENNNPSMRIIASLRWNSNKTDFVNYFNN